MKHPALLALNLVQPKTKHSPSPLFSTRLIIFLQPLMTVAIAPPPSLCTTSLYTFTAAVRDLIVQHSRRSNVGAGAMNTVRRCPPRCASDVMLSNFRLGDHAESLFPHHHSCLSTQTIPASCANASFHIVSPLCKSKCGNRIQLIL